MYNVVILAEQAMTPGDAEEVVSLHESIEDTRHYHIVIPCENAAQRVDMAMGSLAASEVMSTPELQTPEFDIEKAQEEINQRANDAVNRSVAAIRAQGVKDVEGSGECSSADPLEALISAVAARQADEVIVMTLPHAVSELFHRDWTSKARRHLGVPILHLLEHEPLDYEGSFGQGISGM